jgi:hypothetical protein
MTSTYLPVLVRVGVRLVSLTAMGGRRVKRNARARIPRLACRVNTLSQTFCLPRSGDPMFSGCSIHGMGRESHARRRTPIRRYARVHVKRSWLSDRLRRSRGARDMWDCRFSPVRAHIGGDVTLVTAQNRVSGGHSNPYLALLVMSAGHADTNHPKVPDDMRVDNSKEVTSRGRNPYPYALVRIPHCRERRIRLLG